MNLKDKRKELNVTLETLAKETEISKGELSRIERGKVNVTIGTLGKIAKALKTELIILFK
jgi:transcriptional regulator with XRE-family HTH domain